MAQYPKIQLRFIQIPTAGKVARIFIGGLTISLTSTTLAPPGFNRYTIGGTLEDCATNFFASLENNYGKPFTFEDVFEGVEITCNRYDLGDFTYDIDNESDFALTITPVEQPEEFSITGLTYLASDVNICNNIKVKAAIKDGTAPYLIRAIYNGGAQQTKTTSDINELFVEFPRITGGSRRVEIDSDGNTATIDVQNVNRVADLGVSVAYTQFAATVTLTANQAISSGAANISPFQYSLDDINYQSANSFDINISGDYTAYIVDKYGCKTSKEFTINIEERKTDPFYKIEITNPIRLVDQNYAGVKNITNTLSADYKISNVEKRFFRQPFRIGYIARLQIKSNYETNAVNIYDCAGELVDSLTPALKVENINLLDKRDALIKTGEPGKTNVAFTQGDIYNPVTNAVIDSYFQGAGRLPSFARVGMLVTFNETALTGTFEVEEIIYDSDLQAWVCVIEANYSGVAVSIVALSTYNNEEYNIYETQFTLNEGQYHIEAVATDTSTLYPDVLWKSEPLYFSDDIEIVVIDYGSDINEALIDYRTNIEFRICVPGRFAKYQPDVEGEDFKDDLGNIYLQKSTYNRTWAIETDLIPWWLAEKVIIASRHRSNLKINGIPVVNSEAPEITDRLGDRNPFYSLTGIYQENIDISVSDETGIISGARGILSGNENQVIGV
jgi:hypothetical protein